MSKVHLIRTEFPLVPGKDQRADCGRVVRKAYFPMIFDEGVMGNTIALNSRYCWKCWDVDRRARYIYGAVDGQENRLGQPE